MEYFETKIVRTWDPSKWLRAVGTVLLLASAAIVFVWSPEIVWLKTTAYIVYFISFFFALSLSFIKPKDLGMISISEDKIALDYKGQKMSFLISDLKELGFNYRGYASFWKHSIHGNKNHLYFTDSSDERFDFEILIQNKEKKEDLKHFLNRIQSNSKLKIERSGNYSF